MPDIVLLEWIPLFQGHSRPAFSLTRRNNRAYEGEQSAEDAGGRGDVGGGEEIGVVEWTCQRIDRSARGGPRHRSRGASPARPTPARATPHDTMSNPLLDSRCPDSRSLPHVVLAPCIFIARALDSLDSPPSRTRSVVSPARSPMRDPRRARGGAAVLRKRRSRAAQRERPPRRRKASAPSSRINGEYRLAALAAPGARSAPRASTASSRT